MSHRYNNIKLIGKVRTPGICFYNIFSVTNIFSMYKLSVMEIQDSILCT